MECQQPPQLLTSLFNLLYPYLYLTRHRVESDLATASALIGVGKLDDTSHSNITLGVRALALISEVLKVTSDDTHGDGRPAGGTGHTTGVKLALKRHVII